MTYLDKTSAEVVADTVYDGVRLTTMRVTLPNIIHKHLLRHRLFSEEDGDTDASFSFESQRAAPVKAHTNKTEAEPFEPLTWRRNGKGMSPSDYLTPEASAVARATHYDILSYVSMAVRNLEALGVHKEQANRYLEPFQWTTCIISSTNWEGFFAQRDHIDAQEEMQTLARAMRKALDESTPDEVVFHIPFCGYSDDETEMIRSVARCARVSYGRELEEKTYEEDKALVERLISSGHWSPFEHVGIAAANWYGPEAHKGNFDYPWSQLRHHWRAYLPSIAERLA